MPNQVRFVRIKKFSELTGYTESAVRSKITAGVWLEGKHYKRAPDANVLINLEEYDKWVEGEQRTQALNRVMGQMAGLSESHSSGKEGAVVKRSKSNRHQQISSMQPA